MKLYAQSSNGLWHSIKEYDGSWAFSECNVQFQPVGSVVTRVPYGRSTLCSDCDL